MKKKIIKVKGDYLWKKGNRNLTLNESMKKINKRDIKKDRKINYAEAMGEYYNKSTSPLDYIITESKEKFSSKIDKELIKKQNEQSRREFINKLDYEIKTGNFKEDKVYIYKDLGMDASDINYDKLSGMIINKDKNKINYSNIYEDKYNLFSIVDLNKEEFINSFELINGLEFLMHAIRMQVNVCAGDFYFDYYYEKTGIQDTLASLVYCTGEEKYKDDIIKKEDLFEVSLDLLFKYQYDICFRYNEKYALILVEK